MEFNDTGPGMAKSEGAPAWLLKLAETATMETDALKRPVQGKADIIALLKRAIQLHDFQDFWYRRPFGEGLFMESHRASIKGTPVECLVTVHIDDAGARPNRYQSLSTQRSTLIFTPVWEQVGDRFRDHFLTA
jgi:hypothetical protein